MDDKGWNYLMIDTCFDGLPCNNALVTSDLGYLDDHAVECMMTSNELGSSIEFIPEIIDNESDDPIQIIGETYVNEDVEKA
jgi:hypothetical protein